MYTVVIDESGDTGVNGVKADPSRGPTQYFCMCATIFNEDNRPKIEERLRLLPFGSGAPHASRLSHFEKVYYCRTISELPVGMLGTISNKLSLLDYLPATAKSPTHFYNKVIQYLLERLGDALASLRIGGSDVRIRLEAREQQYSSLLSFIESIQRTPLDTRATSIRNIDRFSISAIKKSDDLCMALCDMGSNAIFSAVRRDDRSFGLSETRHVNELRPVFLADKNGKICPKGIKPIHSIDNLQLPGETSEFFASLKNPRADYHRLP